MLGGGGVIGLMRTNPQESSPGAELASQVGDLAIQVGDLAIEAKEKVGEWSADAGEMVERAGEVAGSVKETVEQWSSDAGETIGQVAGTTKILTDRGTETLYGIVQDAEERDKYLLGAAAVAIVAAVGVAYQKR